MSPMIKSPNHSPGVAPISVDSDDDDSEEAQGDGVSSGDDDLLTVQIKFDILKA